MKNRSVCVLLIIVFFSKVLIFSQSNKNMYTEDVSCKEVINYLRKLHRNDSVAVKIFWEKYRIVNINMRDAILKKNHVEMIQFVNS